MVGPRNRPDGIQKDGQKNMDYKKLNELVLKWQRDGDLKARNEAVSAMTGAVVNASRKLSCKRMDRADFIQEGFLGVLQAADTFRVGKASFPSYASRAARNAMFNALRRNMHAVETGREKLKPSEVEVLPDSFLLDVSDDGDTPEVSVLKQRTQENQNALLNRAWDKLTDKEKGTVVRGYLGKEPINMSDLAREEGVSRQCLSQMRENAFRKIRLHVHFAGEDINDYL